MSEARELFGDVIDYGWQISIENFYEIFKNAFPNPTYEKLMSIDAGIKGYEGFFNHCKEKGILN